MSTIGMLMPGVGLLLVLGLYGVLLRPNIVKKLIALGVFTNGIHLFLIGIGYREGGVAPIALPGRDTSLLLSGVDPLPQALVLTSIVIELSVTALCVVLVVRHYRETGRLTVGRSRE